MEGALQPITEALRPCGDCRLGASTCAVLAGLTRTLVMIGEADSIPRINAVDCAALEPGPDVSCGRVDAAQGVIQGPVDQ